MIGPAVGAGLVVGLLVGLGAAGARADDKPRARVDHFPQDRVGAAHVAVAPSPRSASASCTSPLMSPSVSSSAAPIGQLRTHF